MIDSMDNPTSQFDGFPDEAFESLKVPSGFFSDYLPEVRDLAELKIVLFCIWALPQKEMLFPYLRRHDFTQHQPLMDGLAALNADEDGETELDAALQRAVERRVLLRAEIPDYDTLYFVNTDRGRTAIQQIEAGQWQPSDSDNPVEILPQRPSIFRLYQDNLGFLTPMLRDELSDMQTEFPVNWIEEAIRIAVENNARSLRYIRAVLERWKQEGRATGEASQQSGEGDGRFISGKYARFIEH